MAQSGSVLFTIMRLLAACCVVIVGVIAAQLIIQQFDLGGSSPTPESTANPAPVPAESPAPPPEETAAESAPAQDRPIEPAAAPEDEFPYQVRATFVSQQAKFSRALLQGPTGASKWYSTGQGPETDLVVRAIRKDRVIFEYRGAEKVQLLKRDSPASPPPATATRGADAPLPQPYIPAQPAAQSSPARAPDAEPAAPPP